MCRVVLFVILHTMCLHVRGENVDNVVRVWVPAKFRSGETFHLTNDIRVLKPNKPLHIILQNYYIYWTSSIECKDLQTGKVFTTTTERMKESGIYITEIIVNKVTDEMSTLWQCDTWISFTIPQIFTFNIHIIERVRVTVGKLVLKYTQTEPSQVEYDGVTEYWYKDGEAVDLVCTRHADSSYDGYIRLTYYNAIGTILFATDEINCKQSAQFRKTMNVENNNDTVACTFISKTRKKYTYKTIFKLESGTSLINPLKLTVNDLKLVPAQPDNETEKYQYKFYEGQILTISCETDKHLLSNLSLRFDSPHLDTNLLTEAENLPWKVTKQLYTNTTLDRQYLRCVNNDNSTQYSAELRLLLDQTDPMILGLSPSDVIHQYSKSSSIWVIDYWYTIDQTLNLTCVAKDPSANYKWIINNTIIETQNTSRGRYRSHIFALEEEHNGTSIICDNSSKKVTINLHAKMDSLDYIFNEGGSVMIVAGALAVSAVTLLSFCLMICSKWRRNKDVRQQSSETMIHDLETPIPAYPSQWDDTSVDYINTEEVLVSNSLYNTNCSSLYAGLQKKAKPIAGPQNDSACLANDYANSVEESVGLAYHNVSHKENIPLCNNEETYDYVLSNNSTRDYVEPVYVEALRPQ